MAHEIPTLERQLSRVLGCDVRCLPDRETRSVQSAPYHSAALCLLEAQRHVCPVLLGPYYQCFYSSQSRVCQSKRVEPTLLLLVSVLARDASLQQHAVWLVLRLHQYLRLILCTSVSLSLSLFLYLFDRLTSVIWPVQKPVPRSNQSLFRSS